MISPAALQQALLSLLCFDNKRAPTLALQLSPKLFIGRQARLIATTSIEYTKQYGLPPGDQIELLLENELRRGEEGKLLGQTLDLLKEQFPSLQADFILTELDLFESAQTITLAATDALEAVARGEIDIARELLYKSGSSGVKKFGNPEIWFSDAKAMFKWATTEDSDFFSTGIEAVDLVGARPERKTISFMIAPTGKGKTWFLINLIKAALQHRKTALYITLELSAEKAAKRLLQNIFALTKDEVRTVRVPYFDKDDQGNTTIQFRELIREGLLAKRRELERRIEDMYNYPPIIIKEFPTRSLSLSQLELYLDFLAKERGFIPDLVAIDYVDIMDIDADNLRIAMGTLWAGLRGVAVKRNIVVASASQGNKESDSATTVVRGHVAEDWSKVGTADNVYTLSQTPQEKKLNLNRILIAKARDNEDGIMVLNSQAYPIGQFSINSCIMAKGVAQEIERVTSSGFA